MKNLLKNSAYLLLLSAAAIFVSSCKKAKEQEEDKPLPQAPAPPSKLFSYPSHFPEPIYDFSQNPLTPEKVQLGKMLFYDGILSADSTISCASCHQPFAAFSHKVHSVSHGIGGKTGTRNAPGIFNVAWQPNFMLDGGIAHLEVQPLAPITDPVEMGETLQNVLRKLNRNATYRQKFKEAFGKDSVDSQQLLKSLTQFMLTIVSCSTKYDNYRQGKATLSNQELEGMIIVQQKCSPCHGGELFTDFSFRNIGLDSNSGAPDLGRENVTGQLSDRRKFRVPTLRNFSLTYPYLHNGLVYTGLNRVLAHHDTLVQDSPTLDPLMKKNGKLGLGISQEEASKIYAFILTLNDPTIATNPAFLTPFDSYEPPHPH